jgi:S1-C subfamily serine protease
MKARQMVWVLLLTLLGADLCFAQAALPGGSEIVTRTGNSYKNVRVQKVDPDGLLIAYTPANGGVGISKVKFEDLPDDLQQRYGYNPTNAAAFEKAERKAAGQLRAQLLAEDAKARSSRLAEELSDAWAGARDSGTGFFITDDGYLLTCYHVVTNATQIKVGTKHGVLSAERVQSR